MKSAQIIKLVGFTLVIAGLILNEWVLTALLSDGDIETWKSILIWSADLAFIVVGTLFIKKAQQISLTNLALLFISLLFGLFLAELGFRWWGYTSTAVEIQLGNPILFQPKPYVMYGGRPNHDYLNRLGYKEAAPALNKPKNEYRIFLLGGSTVFAGEPTISRLLEQRFHKENLTNVKCFNFGIPASVSGMELARLVYEVADYQPDMVIMYNGGNDIMNPLWTDPRPGFPFNYYIYENNPVLKKNVDDYPAIDLLLFESKIIRHLIPAYFYEKFTRYGALRKKMQLNSENWKSQIIEKYLINLRKAEKVTVGFGADFFAFFQPLVYYKKPLTEKEKKSIQKIGSTNYANEMRLKFRNQLSKNDSNIFDLSNLFNNDKELIFLDYIHITQEAKPKVSKAIYREIEGKVKSAIEATQ